MTSPRTLDEVVTVLGETDGDAVDLYGTLAPVYAFVIEWATIPTLQHDRVTTALDDPDSVLELACGMGALLDLLDGSYDDVVGVDASQALLSIARTKTDAPLVRADVRQWRARTTFDAALMLGHSLGHLTDDGGARACFERTAGALADGGQFLVNCHDASAYRSERTQEHPVEGDEYRVEHESQLRPAGPETDLVERTDAFEITRKETGETVTAETGSWTFRAYEEADVRAELERTGFEVVDVETVDDGFDVLAEKCR